MRNSETKQRKKNYNLTSIRVSEKTKEKVKKFLAKINQAGDCGKVNFDMFVNFSLEKITKPDIEALQLKAVSWVHEELRLRRLWEQKNGKVSDEEWKEMLFLGQLQGFITSHSRLRVVTKS